MATAVTRDIINVIKKEAKIAFENTHWREFYSRIMGTNGVIRKLITDPAARHKFEQSDDYEELMVMLRALRSQADISEVDQKRARVITVRLPADIHEGLMREAHDKGTSLNKLCVSKLLEPLPVLLEE